MMVGELFPEEVRTKYVGLAFSYNWIWNIAIVFSFKYFDGVKWLVHALYGGVTAVLLILGLILIPETRGKQS
jgi:hypothetical protein